MSFKHSPTPGEVLLGRKFLTISKNMKYQSIIKKIVNWLIVATILCQTSLQNLAKSKLYCSGEAAGVLLGLEIAFD
jgi:large-conductance mechanosensitive channel